MNVHLSPLQSRMAALALAVLVLAIMVRVLVLPVWRAWHDTQQSIEQQQALLVRFRRIAADLGPLRKQLEALKSGSEIGRYTLHGGGTLAGATLQERVKKSVEQSEGKLISTQIQPPADEGTFERVTITVRLQIPTEGLQHVLYDLESGLPVLTVGNLMILSRNLRPMRSRRSAQNMLDVRFDVSGYLHTRGQ